ncbi:integrase [Muribacter muris]|uniref:Integrase n=1 Tax=Muribacter muris TaxID=67855 RepID=A0A4Y9JPF6_9PAST|nr:tyrosine-type recombinase/integrase [Muribacter muris]MBF0786158.1 tyrosine-type recombinase/integrase [Muribacter muris]MBF0828311.1 tyrosine-type recombinase/integrase [Muribacter muris]TFV07683.1 integrase [Muribacter muris]
MGRPRKKENRNLPDNVYLRITKRKSGKIVKRYTYRVKGKQEIELGSDYNRACLKAAQMNIERESPNADVMTFGMVAKRYKDEVISQKRAKNTQQSNLSYLKALLAFFHNAPLDEIEPPHVVEYMQRRKDTPGAANNEYSLFNHIWKYAKQWGYTKLPSPAESVNKFPIKRRDIYVEDHIFQLIYQHANQDMQDLMDLAYLTGQRPVDIVSIQKEHIFDGYLHITQQKTKAKLRIKLVGKLADILSRRLQSSDNLLFKSKKGIAFNTKKVTDLFSRLRQKVSALYPEYATQINEFQFRDLRAKSGTDKAMAQGEEAARQQLGHTTVQMTKTYIRKAPIVTPLIDTVPPSNQGE